MLYGRHPAHTFAKTQNTPALRALAPDNEVWVSPAVASERGIRAGDLVTLRNQDGIRSLPVRARVTTQRPDPRPHLR